MAILNIEIKARLADATHARKILEKHQADFKGLDHQIDHYFQVKEGRLKLREGNIERSLIHYNRANKQGPKASDILLYETEKLDILKEILLKSLDTLVVIDKKREIYYIENVKFHIDQVQDLGEFIEIEAIDKLGNIGREKLLEQCEYYMDLLKIEKDQLLSHSYSDMKLQQKT